MGLKFQGIHAEIVRDRTLERDVEGALASGKTTACIRSEIDALKAEPGIWALASRWTGEATDTLLRPALEQVFAVEDFGDWKWDDKKKYYEWPNDSRMYCFGLKTQSQDPEERYGKIRGLAVSRIYISQAEQFPEDIAAELRSRMRPDIEAQARGDRYRRQLTFDANPVEDNTGPSGHWLAKQFPVDNHIPGRKYFRVSLYDNAHNLEPGFVDQQVAIYPVDHPKHRTMILGQRGLAVMGTPIYEGVFDRKLHVRAVLAPETGPFLEAFDVGKHNPTWLLAHRTPSGTLRFLGGLMANGLGMDDFLPLVRRYRADWYPHLDESNVRSCMAPMGDKSEGHQPRFTMLRILQQSGIRVQWRDTANAPDVRVALIDQMSGLLRKRAPNREECIGVNNDPERWIMASREGIQEAPFLAYAFEGGYTWSKHFVSVAHKTLKQPMEDDHYANAMHCAENILLNFCGGLPASDTGPTRVNWLPNHAGWAS